MEKLSLKAGQVAAALNISTKRLQNTVDAGYLSPAFSGQGRGSLRQFSFEDVVRLQMLEILIHSYGVAPPRAAEMLAEVWPRPFNERKRMLVIHPQVTWHGVELKPIKLPFGEIAAATRMRIQQVLSDYHEKKRGRPAGWSAKFTESLDKVSKRLQTVSDEQIEQEITNYRRRRHTRKS